MQCARTFLSTIIFYGLIAISFSSFCLADTTDTDWNPGFSCFPENLCKKNEEITRKAVHQKTPSICNKIKKRVYHQDYGVSPKQQRQQCRINYAIETGDIKYCKSFNQKPDHPGSLPWRDVCLSGLARRLKRPDLCDDIYGMWQGAEREYYKESCLVQSTYSLDQCETYKIKEIMYYNVKQNFYDLCIRSVAENTRQPAVCDMITDANQRVICRRPFEFTDQ